MSTIQREIHNLGQAIQRKWDAYFYNKEMHEILYDLAGAVVSCAAVMLFFANPLGSLLTLGVSTLAAYGLHKIQALTDKPGLKAALMLLVAPILGALSAYLVGYPVSYFAAVVLESAILWAASKCPMPLPQAEALI